MEVSQLGLLFERMIAIFPVCAGIAIVSLVVAYFKTRK